MQIQRFTDEQQEAYLAAINDMSFPEKSIIFQETKINSLTKPQEHEENPCDSDND